MKVHKTNILNSIIIEPDIHTDERGLFLESWNENNFQKIINLKYNFVQDNHSKSIKGVLRGLHYQLLNPQGKLIRVVSGEVIDVVVDMRKSSPTFGKHLTINLSEYNFKILWVPPGCAHGFFVTSKEAVLLYKTTDYYNPKDEYCIIWNDPTLNIDWSLKGIKPKLSVKDKKGKFFLNAKTYE